MVFGNRENRPLVRYGTNSSKIWQDFYTVQQEWNRSQNKVLFKWFCIFDENVNLGLKLAIFCIDFAQIGSMRVDAVLIQTRLHVNRLAFCINKSHLLLFYSIE